jgi:hypothetical protein
MQINLRETPTFRVAVLEKEAIERLDRAHDAENLAAAQSAARLIERIYEDIHATIDVIEAMYGFRPY